ncbi:MAG: AzlD domain-containing protein [Bacillota bacterium]|jgi:branched-subunit amino acid transport protein AzlD|nr:AzlD domain-containing protein [Bacillota bacterium]
MNEYVVILLVSLITIFLRFLPFMLFKNGKLPKTIEKIGDSLPSTIMILLVIYCVKNINIFTYNYGLPELIAVSIVVLIHLYKRNMLLSIFLGTITYMFLIQYVFI